MDSYRCHQICNICLCHSLHCVLSLGTLPSNWGILMVTKYGITSFASARDVGHETNVWFVDTTHQSHVVARQKLMPTKTNEIGATLSKESQIYMVPNTNTTSLQCCSCAINYSVFPPSTTYNSNIRRASLQYSPFPILLPPYKDSTLNLSTHIRRKSWLG